MNRSLLHLATAFSLALSSAPASAQAPAILDSTFLAGLPWRPIGPANMSGRITDIEGIPGSATFYIAAAAGGIHKTINNGTTFRPIFDDQRVISMGDLAIAPSDTSIIWAGTGEEDSRNSISPGGGIFKSTDGGMTWQDMGLRETEAIGRIVIHPTDPNIVYVAALGAIWRSNPERGLYKTTDGGRTWRNVKFISDKAGFVDVAMHPRDPNTLYAASWERVRGPYFLQSGGPGSALWKSTDAGETWTEIQGGGFPETTKGRIGIAISRSNPDVVYTIVEAAMRPGDRERLSGLYRSQDGGRTWEHMNDRNVRPFYYSQVRVDPADPNRVYWSSTPVNVSNDGGRTIGITTIGLHVDHHAMWIDPTDPNRLIVGNDGGIGLSYDRGGSYDFVNNVPLGQFYEISYNMEVPYRVCGGLQDNGTWCGPSRTSGSGNIFTAHWANVYGGDGFFTAQDPTDPTLIFAESQAGNMGRVNMATGERTPLRKPNWRDRYRIYEDSILIQQPDTAQAVTPEVARNIQALRVQAARDSAEFDMRFNWNTPFFISPHSRSTFYTAANRVLKSTDFGNDLAPISPDLTTRDTMKIRISTLATGGVTPDLTGAETFSTIVALAESPRQQGMLFAGTDDGNVWMSTDDGGNWQNLNGRFPGLPEGTYVRRIEPSSHDANVFYLAFDGHRTGDFLPYLYMTSDGGRTFRSLAGDLPRGGPDFLHVVREDPVNPNLLFVGSDVGVYVSLDRGMSWQRFMTDLPTVPVHDLQIHPRDRELIAGTHGRSIWIADIAPLQQLRGAVPTAVTLFQPKPGLQYGSPPVAGGTVGNRAFIGWSPPFGAEITYYLPQEASEAEIAILTPAGETVQTLTGPAAAGLNRAYWNLRKAREARTLSPSERRDSLLQTQRLRTMADSVAQAGTSRQVVDEAVALILSGNFSGFGGRPSAPRGEWVERPGEEYPVGAGGADVNDVARQLAQGLRRFNRSLRSGYDLLNLPTPEWAETGEYTVSLRVNGVEQRQPLRVIR